MNNAHNGKHAVNPIETMRGIVTVLNTPFTADGAAIDHDAFARHIAYALAAGVQGFLAPAMAGEAGKLRRDERIALTKTMLAAVGGRVPVIGCATAEDPKECIALAEELTLLGCDGILASVPFADEADYAARVHALANTQPGFLMLQDWDPVGYGIPLTTIHRLFEEVPAFKCIKIEVAEAGRKYTEALAATNGALHVSGGWAVAQMMEGLDRGVHAFMPTGLHYTYTTLYNRYAAGDRAGAQHCFHRLAPILAFSNQRLEISIAFFKRLLQRQGIYPSAAVRSPAYPFDPYQERIAEELIALAMRLEEEMSKD